MSHADKKPTLTVGLPVYNSSHTVLDSVNSVLNQNWLGDLELLVVDDGSNDDTYEILSDKKKEDPRIRIVRHSENFGRPYARNTILKYARGKYLAWIDSDDHWYPDKLRVQFETFYKIKFYEKRKNDIICMCSFHWKWSHGEKSKEVVPNLSGDQLRKLLDGRIGAYLWSMLGETEAFRKIGYFDVNLPRLQDLDFIIRFVSKGGILVGEKKAEPLCFYNKFDEGKHPRSISMSLQHLRKKHFPLFKKYGPVFERKCKANHHALIARHAIFNSKWVTGHAHRIVSFVNWPPTAVKEYLKNLRN